MINLLIEFILKIIIHLVCLPYTYFIMVMYGERPKAGELLYGFMLTFPVSLLGWIVVWLIAHNFYAIWTAH